MLSNVQSRSHSPGRHVIKYNNACKIVHESRLILNTYFVLMDDINKYFVASMLLDGRFSYDGSMDFGILM